MISSAAMSISSIVVVLVSNVMKFIKFDPSETRGYRRKKKNEVVNTGLNNNENEEVLTYSSFSIDSSGNEGLTNGR